MRQANWKTATTFEERKVDWHAHNKIINFLCQYTNWKKATQEEDYEGIDIWYGVTSWDLKITVGYPKSCSRNLEDYDLFKWYLENQDLDRFHNTNRIIVLQHNSTLDVLGVACQIENAIEQQSYYQNITYRLKGRGQQENHVLNSKIFRMDKGLLVNA